MHLKNIAAIAVALALSLTLLTACSGGGSDGEGGANADPADTTVARIDIARNAVLLTEPAQSTLLTAQAYNAADEPVDAVFTWSASNPNNVAVVMDTGEITAGVPGSSVITASADGVTSNPSVTLHATPVADAILVSDTQIISDPVAIDPAATVSMGAQFVVTLSGITPPAPGTIIIGSEAIPLAGRVVSSQSVAGIVEVTLEIVPINEVFDSLVFDEVINLSKVEVVASPVAAQYYTMSRGADGRYIFDLKPDAIDPATGSYAAPKASRIVTSRIGRPLASVVGTVADFNNNPTYPFVCKATGPSFNAANGNQIFTISPVNSISVEPDPDLVFEYNDNIGGLQKIGLNTTTTFSSEFKITISAALEGKIDCQLELFELNAPLPGPIGFLLGIQIPIGAGVELAGKVTLADVGLSIKAEAEAIVNGALVCPLGICGSLEGNASVDGKVTPDINFPPGFDGDVLADLRFEPSLTGYGFLNIKVGPVLFPQAQVTLIENKAGLAHKANLSFVKVQISNTNYKSDYKLEINASTTLGSGIVNAVNLLGVTPFTAPKFEIAIPLTTSPTAASMVADVASFQSGDLVTFDISLNADTINYFPLIYNVDEILIYRRVTDAIFGDTVTQVASATASSGQTDFSATWIATSDGDIGDNFFAFVDSTLMPIPYLGELELGKVVGTPSESIQFNSLFFDSQVAVECGPSDDRTLLFDTAFELTDVPALLNILSSGLSVGGVESKSSIITGLVSLESPATDGSTVFSVQSTVKTRANPANFPGDCFSGKARVRYLFSFFVLNEVNYTLSGQFSATGSTPRVVSTALNLFSPNSLSPPGLILEIPATGGNFPILQTGSLEPGSYGLDLECYVKVDTIGDISLAESAETICDITFTLSVN